VSTMTTPEVDGSLAKRARRVPWWPVVVARVYVGAVFAAAGARQLTNRAPWVSGGETWAGAVRDQLTAWLPHSTWWYHGVVTGVLVPHAGVVAPVVAWTNLIVGESLALGLATRPAAAIGLALLIQYLAASGDRPYAPGPIAAYAALLLTLWLADAGRRYGIDGLLRQRPAPRWAWPRPWRSGTRR